MTPDSTDPRNANEAEETAEAAATWDSKPWHVELAASVARAMAEDVPFRPDMHIMDFGCGSGLITYHLAPQVASIVAADVSAEVLATLTRNAQASGMAHVRTLLLEAEDPSHVMGSCDAIVSSMVFHHISDIPQLLRRFAEWLRRDGWVAIADLEPEDGTFHSSRTHVAHHGIEPSELASHVETAGFAVRSVRTVHALQWQPEDATEVRVYPVFLLVARKTL
jgi:tRNA (cmo5U34)-methyltransferase